MKSIRIVFLFILFALFCSVGWAVSYPLFHSSNRILEDAHFAFDCGDYGTALRLAEDAKITRRQEVQECMDVLDQSLKPFAVQKAGDVVFDVRAVLLERDVFDAVEMIDYLLDLKGEEYFDNSIAKIRSYIERKKIFPETNYLIARVYEFEGEYELSHSYYMEAWQHSDVLDIPDMKYSILYDMANLSYNFSRLDESEKALLLVVAEDPFFSDSAFTNAILSSVRRGYSVDKIFNLYRTNCYRSIPAFFRLAELYAEQSKTEDAFTVALFGVLTAFTRMHEIVDNRTTEFEYTSLDDFFKTAMKHDDIMEWSISNDFWRCIYRLAELGKQLYPNNELFGKELLAVIASTAPENYWKQLALSKLFN